MTVEQGQYIPGDKIMVSLRNILKVRRHLQNVWGHNGLNGGRKILPEDEDIYPTDKN